MRKDRIKYSVITLHIGDCTRPLPRCLSETTVSANLAFCSQGHSETEMFSSAHLERNSLKLLAIPKKKILLLAPLLIFKTENHTSSHFFYTFFQKCHLTNTVRLWAFIKSILTLRLPD